MKKAISVFAIALLLIGMFSPIVSADITLTSEFVEPVKNASFEDRDDSIPGDGVYSSPPWISNNGGWRDLRGDVDSDGDVDGYDLGVFSDAFGTMEGDPNYDWRCDFDGDGDVDGYDLGTFADDFGKTANRVDGAHSWYTSGGGNYQIWQWLDSNTINAVKGKQVAFAFWFLPESVASDGSENYARAEIWYSFTFENRPQQVKQYGDWVYPNETKWHSAFVVTATLPSTTSSVKVIIYGKPDFKAWIDLTSLSITETKLVQEESIPLKVSLAVNLFELKDYGMPVDPYRAFLEVSMSADAPYPYLFLWTEIKIKLIAGSFVRITNVTQSNDANYITDPDQTEEIENKWIVAGQIATGVIVTIALFSLPQIGPYHIGNLILDLITGAGLILLMSTYRSDADTPYTDDLGGYAKAGIGYGGPIVHFANERLILELGFNPGSSCQVEVTAKAKFWTIDGTKVPDLETSILVTVSL